MHCLSHLERMDMEPWAIAELLKRVVKCFVAAAVALDCIRT